jgi:curved DNA-binding protein CbpA
MPDYYQILGVERNASLNEIRRAYRAKAKLFDPDVNKSVDAKDIFEQINEAYQYLKDNHGRIYYDQPKFDSNLYRKYGKNYNNHQNVNSKIYNANNTYSKEQAEADKRQGKFARYVGKYLGYFFLILAILFTIAVLIDVNEDTDYTKRYLYPKPHNFYDNVLPYLFIAYIWIAFGIIAYYVYRDKKKLRNKAQDKNGN